MASPIKADTTGWPRMDSRAGGVGFVLGQRVRQLVDADVVGGDG